MDDALKRFTDTGKWEDKWFRSLSPTAKLLWSWLLDHCDNAGVIDPDIMLATFQIGDTVKEDHFTELGDRIQSLPNGKRWIPKFIRFQFGQLSPESRVHASVVKLLLFHNIQYPMDSLSIAYVKGIDTLKDKDKYKDKEPEGVRGRFTNPSQDEVKLHFSKSGLPMSEAEKFFHYYESNGWHVGKNPMKSWTAAASNWKKNYEEGKYETHRPNNAIGNSKPIVPVRGSTAVGGF